MQRRDFLRSAGLGMAFGTAAASPAVAQSAPEIRWRLISSFASAPGTIRSGVEIFAKQLAELTDGRFQIEIVPGRGVAAQGGLQAFEAVGSGGVEMAHGAAADCFSKDPAFAIACAVPFGLSGRQQSAWLIQGGGSEAFNVLCRRYDVVALPMGNACAPVGAWFWKEIRSLKDLSGAKMSVGGMAGAVLARLGVVPEEREPASIHAALDGGEIDGAAWAGPYDEAALDLARVARYCYTPGLSGDASLHLFVNVERWNSLPHAYRTAIANASLFADSWIEARADTDTRNVLKGLAGRGAKLAAFPRDVTVAARHAARALYAELSQGNADFSAMMASMTAFRDDAFLWSQVAEYGSDAPSLRARL